MITLIFGEFKLGFLFYRKLLIGKFPNFQPRKGRIFVARCSFPSSAWERISGAGGMRQSLTALRYEAEPRNESRDLKNWGFPSPAVNCRAIVICPYGTKTLGINSGAESQSRLRQAQASRLKPALFEILSVVPAGLEKLGVPFPGSELPGYCHLSLRDKKIPANRQSVWVCLALGINSGAES